MTDQEKNIKRYDSIKFRYFNTVNKEMIYIRGVINRLHWFVQECIENGKFPIMQFTGLKDCEGNDIYEGDILFSDWHDSEWIVKNGEYQNFSDDYLSGFYLECISNKMNPGYKMCLTTYSITYNNNNFKISKNIYEKE